MFFYNLLLALYSLAIRLVAPANSKARLWLQGRKNIFRSLNDAVFGTTGIIWFHAASLGEFEQGRPLIEEIKNRFPDKKVLLTFYSPSGYEIRKNYALADYVFYLPHDTKANAHRFIETVQPEMVFFIKYEFWQHYLNEIGRHHIPLYLISGVFRPNQVFFRWYGRAYRKVLQHFTHFFVQNESSKQLLNNIGINNITVNGDTRFDRVISTAKKAQHIELARVFSEDSITLIAGSTWPPDEEIIARYMAQHNKLKVIIAPHEVHPSHIKEIEKTIKLPAIRYTQASTNNVADKRVMIIDNIGMLSSLYQYGQVAYIGGGFGKGIHNILEAATFGMPVIFGPRYKKFSEALAMVSHQAAFSINGYNSFKVIVDKLLNNNDLLEAASLKARQYVASNAGATDKIMDTIFGLHEQRSNNG